MLALTAAACETSTQTRVQASVIVEDDVGQTISGWGGSVVADTPNDPLVVPGGLTADELRELDDLIFRRAGIDLIRVFAPGYGTQLESGDLVPRNDDPRWAFMRRVDRYGVRFMLTGADAPDGLKHGTDLAEGAEDAYADYLADVLEFARDEVGVPFDYVAVANEPDNEKALVTFGPQQAARVYAALADEIGERGLEAQFVLGDDTGWNTTLAYARAELAAPGVAASAAAIASHGYAGSEDDRRAVAALGEESGLPVWQTEWGTGCPDCDDDRSMLLALEWSQRMAADLVEGEVAAWFVFRPVADSTHGPGDALVVRQRDDPDEPFYATKRFQVFRHYASAAPAGARRLEVRVREPDADVVAFRNGDAVSLVVTNPEREPLELPIDLGERSGIVRLWRTSPHEDFRALAPLAYERRPLAVTFAAESVTTLTLS